MSGTSADSPFSLPNDWQLNIPIEALTNAGVIVALPSGDIPSVTSSGDGLHVEIGTVPPNAGTGTGGDPAIVLWATVDGSLSADTVYTVTLSDSADLNPSTLFFKIVPDNRPTSLEADLPGATHTLRAAPGAG